VDCHGRGLALVLAQNILAVAHIRFAQLALFDGLLWGGLCGRGALGCRWAWWIATTRCLASSRDLGGGHGGRIGLTEAEVEVEVYTKVEMSVQIRESAICSGVGRGLPVWGCARACGRGRAVTELSWVSWLRSSE
jgi:hypothetical protein